MTLNAIVNSLCCFLTSLIYLHQIAIFTGTIAKATQEFGMDKSTRSNEGIRDENDHIVVFDCNCPLSCSQPTVTLTYMKG